MRSNGSTRRPIYLLSDIGGVQKFCDHIEKRSAAIQRAVGFNLDVPHWWLAENVDPSWLLGNGGGPATQDTLRHWIAAPTVTWWMNANGGSR